MTFDSFEQFHEYVQTNASRTFVREQVDGKWGTFPLEELGADKTLEWARRWWDENRMPIMLKKVLDNEAE